MTKIEDHDTEFQSKNLNRFIAKLYSIINSDEPTVRWVPGGKRFLILDPKKFSQTVLPKYFKHSKFTSFVRQLNFYGFHKKRILPSDIVINENADSNTADRHALAALGDAVCFQHDFFLQNEPKLLLRIQRTTKQASMAAAAESLSLTKQKEIEGIQEQLREMQKRMDSSQDEFEVKLAAARAEIELDYLHRIRAIEVCYKDLVTMLLRNQKSFEFPLPKRKETRYDSGPDTSAPFRLPVPRSISDSSRSTANRRNTTTRSVLLGQTYNPRDYLVEQKLDMLSQLHQKNGSRRTLFDDLGAKRNNINVSALVGAATKHVLSNTKEFVLEKNGAFDKKIDGGLPGRESLTEILRRNQQLLAHFATGNAAA